MRQYTTIGRVGIAVGALVLVAAFGTHNPTEPVTYYGLFPMLAGTLCVAVGLMMDGGS